MIRLILLLLALLVFGCDEDDKKEQSDDTEETEAEDDDGEKKKKKKKKKKKDDDDDDTEGEDDDGADKPADKKGDGDKPLNVTRGKEATPFIGKNSKVPTLAEWNAVPREVAVGGSSVRNCETKMVREWLRISCRGDGAAGTPIQSVSILSGKNAAENFVFSQAGTVASLVMRFKPGTDLKALFVWTNNASTLHVFWPRGAPEPASKGSFK